MAPSEDDNGEKDGDKPLGQLPKWLIRVVVILVAVISALAALEADTEPLPSVALGEDYLFKLEIALLVFYGALLLVTPLLQGVLNGRLPTEITARGAKYDPEEVSDSLQETEERVSAVEETLESTGGETFSLRSDLAELRESVEKLQKELQG